MSFSQPHTQSTNPMDANGVNTLVLSETATTPAPSRPPPSQRQRAESARALSTPQKSPNKRIADIAAALDESEPQSPSTPQYDNPQQIATDMNGRTRSFLFGSQSSQASTIGDWEEMPQDDLELSGPSTTSADQSFRNIEQRTPKKPRFTPVEQQLGVQIPLPPTPPRTAHRRDSSGQGIFQTDFPETPTRNKGKERENSGREQTTSGTNVRVSYPFESGSSTLERASDVPARTSKTLERTSSNPFIVNQTTGESIALHLEALEALKSPSYIRKMEKKLSALDQSNKFKTRYLEDIKAAKAEIEKENARLIAENARLVQANAHLQERLLQSDQRSRVKDIEIAAIKSRRPPNM
ncbi:hypothetical protein BDR07DRAFT_1535404 [Suillus spraguei]|nr:hypothetical protein BDR07DRAFT_1535404 [Suillus spraguei]